jgi:hypothetical protein
LNALHPSKGRAAALRNIPEMNRMCLVLFDMKNRMSGPCLGQVARLPFDPPVFQPSKLRVAFLAGAGAAAPPPPTDRQSSGHPSAPRRYTLTHNDLTGELCLSVGVAFHDAQLSGWCVCLPIRPSFGSVCPAGGAGTTAWLVRHVCLSVCLAGWLADWYLLEALGPGG